MLHYRDDSGVLGRAMLLTVGLAVLGSAGPRGWGTTPSAAAAAPSAEDDFEALAQDLRQAVHGLKYSDLVARGVVDLIRDWKLVDLKRDLAKARVDSQQGQLPKAQLAQFEQRVAGDLGRTIHDQIRCSEGQFELADVVRNKTADCLGFAQVLYVVGNSLGLSVKAIDVTQLTAAVGVLPAGSSHVACLIELADGRMMMVDVATAGPALVSEPFRWQAAFDQHGDYWELRRDNVVSGLHRRIRVLEQNGLIACVYDNRGDEHNKRGQHALAIADFTTAIELDPKCVGAYNNRGIAWHRLGKVGDAIGDYTVAIDLDSKCGEAYYNRGNVYGTLGDFSEAIADYTQAVKLNEKYTWAYTNRGNAYFNLAKYREAIADHSKAVELDPGLAEAYSNRGNAYKSLGQYQAAIADHTRAIAINPSYAGFYINRAIAQCRLERTEEGTKDLRKAVELDPELKPRVRELGRHFRLNLGL